AGRAATVVGSVTTARRNESDGVNRRLTGKRAASDRSPCRRMKTMNRERDRRFGTRNGMAVQRILGGRGVLPGSGRALLARRAIARAQATGARLLVAAGEFEAPLAIGFPLPPHGGPMGGDGPGMMLPLLLFAGDLSDEQRDKVHEIMKANRQTISGLF